MDKEAIGDYLNTNEDSDSGSEYLPDHEQGTDISSSDGELSVDGVNDDTLEASLQNNDAVEENGDPENDDRPTAAPVRRGRKRLREEHLRARNMRKHQRNSGQTYTSITKKQVQAKVFKNVQCTCRKKCYNLITEEQRRNTFKSFWEMANFSRQNAYLCGLVKRMPIKQRRPRNNSRGTRVSANEYYLNIDTLSVKVCKQYFQGTFDVSDGRLMRAIKKEMMGDLPGEDLRGKAPSINKTSELLLEDATAHIKSFPAYQSHYTRAHNPNLKYLSSDLNIAIMYRAYKAKAKEENDTKTVSMHVYRGLFKKMNLHFHCPAKDTCQKCDAFKMKASLAVRADEKTVITTQHELHLRKADKARESLKSDGEAAKQDTSVHAITFDLQKALAFPQLSVSVAYYKRNMYCYNLGVHDLGKGTGIMYTWDETDGSRGSQEIASCVVKHIRLYAADKNSIVLYSDSCTGQNRNIKMALSLMKLVSNTDIQAQVIDHKFLQSGHSYLPNDSDFGNIEKAAKHKKIYVPEDWYEIIRTARRKNAFTVHKMQHDEFKSTLPLEMAITRRKTNVDGGNVRWLDIQWIRFKRSNPYTMFYKETLSEDVEFSKLDLTPNKGRVRNMVSIVQNPMYPRKRCVPKVKKQDMLDLLPFIPPCYHEYFTSLRTNNNEDTGPLSDHEADEID